MRRQMKPHLPLPYCCSTVHASCALDRGSRARKGKRHVSRKEGKRSRSFLSSEQNINSPLFQGCSFPSSPAWAAPTLRRIQEGTVDHLLMTARRCKREKARSNGNGLDNDWKIPLSLSHFLMGSACARTLL